VGGWALPLSHVFNGRVVHAKEVPRSFAGSPMWCIMVNIYEDCQDETGKERHEDPERSQSVNQFSARYLRDAQRSRETKKGVLGMGGA
jgi:hypothetical protein